jgi:hypothetical protein
MPASAVLKDSLKYWPNRLEFRFEAPGPGWLIVPDRWSQGWLAQVNRVPTEVYGTDFLFRALRVKGSMPSPAPAQTTIRYAMNPVSGC